MSYLSEILRKAYVGWINVIWEAMYVFFILLNYFTAFSFLL